MSTSSRKSNSPAFQRSRSPSGRYGSSSTAFASSTSSASDSVLRPLRAVESVQCSVSRHRIPSLSPLLLKNVCRLVADALRVRNDGKDFDLDIGYSGNVNWYAFLEKLKTLSGEVKTVGSYTR